MERLTSRENALIKEYRKLCGSRKRREETGCFVLEGARLVLDAAESGIPLRTLLVSDDGARYPEAEKLAGMARRCFSIPNELAAYISETEHPQGIFAVGEMPKAEPLTMRAGSYLLLDELQDPGNLGTILRTAEAMGVTAVVLSAHCPDLFSPKVIRSTMGSGWRQKTVRVVHFGLFSGFLPLGALIKIAEAVLCHIPGGGAVWRGNVLHFTGMAQRQIVAHDGL